MFSLQYTGLKKIYSNKSYFLCLPFFVPIYYYINMISLYLSSTEFYFRQKSIFGILKICNQKGVENSNSQIKILKSWTTQLPKRTCMVTVDEENKFIQSRFGFGNYGCIWGKEKCYPYCFKHNFKYMAFGKKTYF